LQEMPEVRSGNRDFTKKNRGFTKKIDTKMAERRGADPINKAIQICGGASEHKST
jgi:hypothetical protein